MAEQDQKMMQAIYVGLTILAVFLFMWMFTSNKHMELANYMAIKYNMSLVDYIALKKRMSVKEYMKWKISMVAKEHMTLEDIMTPKEHMDALEKVMTVENACGSRENFKMEDLAKLDKEHLDPLEGLMRKENLDPLEGLMKKST